MEGSITTLDPCGSCPTGRSSSTGSLALLFPGFNRPAPWSTIHAMGSTPPRMNSVAPTPRSQVSQWKAETSTKPLERANQ
mgnify:CR=1 FL=1